MLIVFKHECYLFVDIMNKYPMYQRILSYHKPIWIRPKENWRTIVQDINVNMMAVKGHIAQLVIFGHT